MNANMATERERLDYLLEQIARRNKQEVLLRQLIKDLSKEAPLISWSYAQRDDDLGQRMMTIFAVVEVNRQFLQAALKVDLIMLEDVYEHCLNQIVFAVTREIAKRIMEWRPT